MKCEVSSYLLRQLTACPLLASCHRYPPRDSRCPSCVWCRVDWCGTNKQLCKHHIYRRPLMICKRAERKPGETELKENGQKTGGKLGKSSRNVSKNISLAFFYLFWLVHEGTLHYVRLWMFMNDVKKERRLTAERRRTTHWLSTFQHK